MERIDELLKALEYDGELAVCQSNYIVLAPELLKHNGCRYYVSQCFEWIGGKWEGFTSMRKVK